MSVSIRARQTLKVAHYCAYGLGSLWGVCTHTQRRLCFGTAQLPPWWNGNGSIRGESKLVREPDPRTHCLSLKSVRYFLMVARPHLHRSNRRSVVSFVIHVHSGARVIVYGK